MICHNLDVMHIEKNFFNNIFNTLMCVPGKTKDHLKARQDLIELGIRSELHPVGSTIPKASYTLNRQQMVVLLEWLKTSDTRIRQLTDVSRVGHGHAKIRVRHAK